MKYIDADKLKKSIDNYMEGAHAALNPIDGEADYYFGKIDACRDIQEFIASIQQEQEEVDLEMEIDEYYHENLGFIISPIDTRTIVEHIARHFWNKGYNARKV